MAELRYPRFNTVYNNREEALKKLNELTRSYGEPVAIRYYNNKKEICIIVAVYKSESLGDYSISYDSNADLIPNTYTVTKDNPDTTDEDLIKTALFGKVPVSNDIVIITDNTLEIPTVKSYIYIASNDSWKILSSSSGAPGTIGGLVLGDSVATGKDESGQTTLEVKVDGSTLIYDELLDGITVKELNGGTF